MEEINVVCVNMHSVFPHGQIYGIKSLTVSTLKLVEYKNRSILTFDFFSELLHSIQQLLLLQTLFLSEHNKFKPLAFSYSVTCSQNEFKLLLDNVFLSEVFVSWGCYKKKCPRLGG